MAGIARVWVVGDLGYDGLTRIEKMVLEGASDRMWFEISKGYENPQLQKVKAFIPPEPRDKNMAIDMCMCFYPEAFNDVPEYRELMKSLKPDTRIDMKFPDGWDIVREKVRPVFEKLRVFVLDVPNKDINGKGMACWENLNHAN